MIERESREPKRKKSEEPSDDDPIGWDVLEILQEDLQALEDALERWNLLIVTCDFGSDGQISKLPFWEPLWFLHTKILSHVEFDDQQALWQVLGRHFHEKPIEGMGIMRLPRRKLVTTVRAQLRALLNFFHGARRAADILQEYYRNDTYLRDFAEHFTLSPPILAPIFEKNTQYADPTAFIEYLEENLPTTTSDPRRSLRLSDIGIVDVYPLTGRVLRSHIQIEIFVTKDPSRHWNEPSTMQLVIEQLARLLGNPYHDPTRNAPFDSGFFEFRGTRDAITFQIFVKDRSFRKQVRTAMKKMENNPQAQDHFDRLLLQEIRTRHSNGYVFSALFKFVVAEGNPLRR